MSFKILSAILRGPWLIDPNVARSYMPSVMNALTGVTAYEDDREPQKPVMAIMPVGAVSVPVVRGPWSMEGLKAEHHKLPEGSAVMVTVHGPLTKADQYCGPIGMASIAGFIHEISAMPKVGKIILDIDSPGGQVDGTQTLADAIKNSSKKTVAYINDGMACSAAYWIASAADEIYVGQKTDVVGSIGVYVTLADFKSYYEAQGLKLHEIYSSRSTEKNSDYREALKGNYGPVQADLDFIADEFINAVKANRPGINMKAGNPFKGATFYAEQALEIGLIDGIQSLDTIISDNMNPENKPAATTTVATTATTEVEETTAAIETTEVVEAPAITLEAMVASIYAMNAEQLDELNTELGCSGLVVIQGTVLQDAVTRGNDLEQQVSELQEYKVAQEKWLKDNDVQHTAIEAREDKISAEDTAPEEALVAAELDYANQRINELY